MMTQEGEGPPHPIDGLILGGATEHVDAKPVATNASLSRREDLGKDFVLTGQFYPAKDVTEAKTWVRNRSKQP